MRYLIAAVVFLPTALLGIVARPVFLVLAMAFVVPVLGAGRATHRDGRRPCRRTPGGCLGRTGPET